MGPMGPHGGVYFVPALTMVTKWSPTPPFALGQDPKGVLAGPGTPRDPKSHLFVTKWVAVAPFGTWGPRPGAEFRCESRQGGPTPLNLNFLFSPLWSHKMPKYHFFCEFSENGLPQPGRIWAPRGPVGPLGAPWAPWGPWGQRRRGGPILTSEQNRHGHMSHSWGRLAIY